MKNMKMTLFLCSRLMRTMTGAFVFMIAECCFCSCVNRSCSAATGNEWSDVCIPADKFSEDEIMDNVKKLGEIFSEMVANYDSFGKTWKNIPLGHRAFELLKDSLPLRVSGELTPYTRIVLLNKMMGCMPERDCARFLKEVKEYQLSMFQLMSDEDFAEDMDIDGYSGAPEDYVREYGVREHGQSLKRTQDYLDSNVSMEEWCKRYGVMLKFDPVERSEQWEKCIYNVEFECDRKLKDEPRQMGFCFSYWSVKKAVLAKYGIEWRSPSVMNPRVMFD